MKDHMWCSAGVPLLDSVAGVAMGLILEPDGKHTILTDILGSEDALGDMDFKVAGTADAVTAFQMDIKVRLLRPSDRQCHSSTQLISLLYHRMLLDRQAV